LQTISIIASKFAIY